ncbi:MAG: DNRLRE domain-containing protein [Thiobacillaceae bacterium]
MRTSTLVHTLIATAIMAGSAHAAAPVTLTFQQGLNGYAGTQDTELRFADKDLITGANESVSIDGDDGPGVSPNHVLMRFDHLFGNGSGQIRAGDTILSATLRLNVFNEGSGFNLHDMLVDWNQNTATWNSMGDGIQTDGVEAAVTPIATFGANNSKANVKTGVLVIDVTSSLQKTQDGLLPGYGWVFMPWPAGTNGIDVDSSESFLPQFRPQLTVEVMPVPEPETYALMLAGLGLVGWIARRRKHV